MSDPGGGTGLVVLCALEVERAAVARRLRRAGRGSIEVRTTGPGAAAMHRAVGALPADVPTVLLCGVSGGLREGIGAVVVVRAVVDGAGSRWECRIGGGGDDSMVVGVDAPVFSAAEKSALREGSGADVVDTESHGFAAACEERALRWGIIRAVSDGPEESLPRESVGWVDGAGRTRLWRLVLDVVRRPGLIGSVVRMGQRSMRGLREVGDVAARVAAAEAATPLPAELGGAATVILFGGSFDPPHRAHVELAERVREGLERAGPAWLVYVPAARSPHKTESPAAGDADRVEMLRRAVAGNRRAVVWTEEIDRAGRGMEAGASYTVDTVRRARRLLGPGVRLRVLMGADQAASFARWRGPRQIIELAEPVVMLRTPHETVEQLMARLGASGFWSQQELAWWRGRVVEVGGMDISATEVREALRAGEAARAEAMLGPGVLEWIRQRGLYR